MIKLQILFHERRDFLWQLERLTENSKALE